MNRKRTYIKLAFGKWTEAEEAEKADWSQMSCQVSHTGRYKTSAIYLSAHPNVAVAWSGSYISLFQETGILVQKNFDRTREYDFVECEVTPDELETMIHFVNAHRRDDFDLPASLAAGRAFVVYNWRSLVTGYIPIARPFAYLMNKLNFKVDSNKWYCSEFIIRILQQVPRLGMGAVVPHHSMPESLANITFDKAIRAKEINDRECIWHISQANHKDIIQKALNNLTGNDRETKQETRKMVYQ